MVSPREAMVINCRCRRYGRTLFGTSPIADYARWGRRLPRSTALLSKSIWRDLVPSRTAATIHFNARLLGGGAGCRFGEHGATAAGRDCPRACDDLRCNRSKCKYLFVVFQIAVQELGE